MARLKIAEKRLPQDGRIRIVMRVEDKSRELDFRVSVRPTLWGETIALRLRDRSRSLLDLSRLGFEPGSLERFRRALSRRSGLVLVSGPQRSGKTSTLLAAIATLNKPEVGIVTVEDPVELSLPGVSQVQIDRAVGEGLASALRSLVHADADVIALGEIADRETADIAVRLAQQGHLVLSALPAGDAASTLIGLLHLGVDPYLLATTVNLVQAQRLVRRICPKCTFDDKAGVASKTLLDVGFARQEVGTLRLTKGRGCTACNGSGYKGRVGLFETLEVTEWIRALILAGAGAAELRDKAVEEGMTTLRMSGLEKIRAGVTTVEEVLRETVADPGSTGRPGETASPGS
jgi:type IV pilus assembly protein PilB